jgi:hypothetical protein
MNNYKDTSTTMTSTLATHSVSRWAVLMITKRAEVTRRVVQEGSQRASHIIVVTKSGETTSFVVTLNPPTFVNTTKILAHGLIEKTEGTVSFVSTWVTMVGKLVRGTIIVRFNKIRGHGLRVLRGISMMW